MKWVCIKRYVPSLRTQGGLGIESNVENLENDEAEESQEDQNEKAINKDEESG